jgi:hypothetical protein
MRASGSILASSSLTNRVLRIPEPDGVSAGDGFGVAATPSMASVQRFSIQGVHLAQARRCALVQRRARRRLGETDAWLVATAESIDADVVGADRIAFERLGTRYLRYR